VLATRNEEANIGRVLNSVIEIADEIVVFDEGSADKTREIARRMGAKVILVGHEPIFHKTKQKAIDMAQGEWVLQLDADEVVTGDLANEIKRVIDMSDKEIMKRRPKKKNAWELFMLHQGIVEARDGKIGNGSGEIVAFFIPRRNYFLGEPLTFAGVYPDAVIRLFKKGRAYLPAKSVHEQMKIDGRVAWMFSDLEHHDSPNLRRYVMRMNRYTDLRAEEYEKGKLSKKFITLIIFSTLKPIFYFFMLFIRHKGIKDGVRGFLWSAFSAMHYPLAYYKYWSK